MKPERAEDDEQGYPLGEQGCLECAFEDGAEKDAQRAEKQRGRAQDGDQGDDLVGLNATERPRRGEERDTHGQQQEAEDKGSQHFAEHDAGWAGPLEQEQVECAALAFGGKRRR